MFFILRLVTMFFGWLFIFTKDRGKATRRRKDTGRYYVEHRR